MNNKESITGISIEKALENLLKSASVIKDIEKVDLDEAYFRVLAEDIYADYPVPDFNRSAMDGYAVCAKDIAGASKSNPKVLSVKGELLAGDYKEFVFEKGSAVRVMTGAYIPDGYDTVVMQEDTDYGAEEVKISKELKKGTNVSPVGEDIKEGEKILEKGTRLLRTHIGLLAELGIDSVDCTVKPKIDIISTGSELLEPGEKRQKGKIYNNISYMIKAILKREGLKVRQFRCKDDIEELTRMLKESLAYADIVITTGGVSVGKKDLLHEALDMIEAEKIFYRADIQPGTPTIGSIKHGKVILSLSGNPYAALVNFDYYIWEIIAYITCCPEYGTTYTEAIIHNDYEKKNKHRRFLRAFIDEGGVWLRTKENRACVISNLKSCNCYVDLEAGRTLKKGDKVRVLYIKQ